MIKLLRITDREITTLSQSEATKSRLVAGERAEDIVSRGSGDTAGDDKKPEYPEYPCAAGPTGNVFTRTNLPPKFSLLESTKR